MDRPVASALAQPLPLFLVFNTQVQLRGPSPALHSPAPTPETGPCRSSHSPPSRIPSAAPQDARDCEKLMPRERRAPPPPPPQFLPLKQGQWFPLLWVFLKSFDEPSPHRPEPTWVVLTQPPRILGECLGDSMLLFAVRLWTDSSTGFLKASCQMAAGFRLPSTSFCGQLSNSDVMAKLTAAFFTAVKLLLGI